MTALRHFHFQLCLSIASKIACIGVRAQRCTYGHDCPLYDGTCMLNLFLLNHIQFYIDSIILWRSDLVDCDWNVHQIGNHFSFLKWI